MLSVFRLNGSGKESKKEKKNNRRLRGNKLFGRNKRNVSQKQFTIAISIKVKMTQRAEKQNADS